MARLDPARSWSLRWPADGAPMHQAFSYSPFEWEIGGVRVRLNDFGFNGTGYLCSPSARFVPSSSPAAAGLSTRQLGRNDQIRSSRRPPYARQLLIVATSWLVWAFPMTVLGNSGAALGRRPSRQQRQLAVSQAFKDSCGPGRSWKS